MEAWINFNTVISFFPFLLFSGLQREREEGSGGVSLGEMEIAGARENYI